MCNPDNGPRPVIPGFYLIRLVRGGPEVPARILADGFFFRVETNGRMERDAWTPADVDALWGDTVMRGEAFAHPLLRIVLFGRQVDECEYAFRTALREWAEKNDPEHPAANPMQPADLTKQRPPF